MRTASQFLIPLPVIAFVFASCAYDAELMGEPEPEVPTEPIYVEVEQDADAELAEYTPIDSESPDAGPVEFVPPAHSGIYAPVDSLDMFGDLRFFGSWYHHDSFGWVWRPTVSRIWKPMTQGFWVWSQHDWMWQTNDRFGQDPYNYGNWVEDTALGWVWVPDCTWEPLRCQWVQWDEYVAWAPLLPWGEGEYRDPWTFDADDTPWMTVRLANFMRYDASRYKITPKFTRGESEQTIVRAPVDIEKLEHVLGRRIERIFIPPRQDFVVVPGPPEYIPVPVPVPDPCPYPPDPCPPYPDPIPPPDRGYDPPRSDPGKMKGGNTPNPPQQKPSQPRNFKEAAKDPPPTKGKSKAK